jgi:fatty-acyl-CoA synthase
MTGYHGMPEATKATFSAGGWLRMGDLGVMDERGYLRIAGRLREVIIRGGMNLYPREIEDVIFDHPEVNQVCVVGVPNEKWGETVAAIVVPRDPASPPHPEHLNAHCRERLASHKSPLHWYFVDEYPLTPTGKVQKFRISEWIDEQRIAPHPWTPNG